MHGPVRVAAMIEERLAAERHNLVLWVPVALGGGIAAYFGLPHPEHWFAAGAAGLALALTGFVSQGLSGRCIGWFGLLFGLGLSLAWARSEWVAAPRLEQPVFGHAFAAEVVAVERQPSRERVRLVLAPTGGDLPPLIRVTARGEPARGIVPGAKVRLRATLNAPPTPVVPGGFDFARRSWFEGVGAVGFASGDIEVVAAAPASGRSDAPLAALRERLTVRITREVGGAAGGIAAALVTGDRGAIPEDVAGDMRDSGLAHLLSISGMHIAVVVGGTMWIVRRLLLLNSRIALRWPIKTAAAAVAALAGIGYTILAGAEVPTLRSCIATLIVLAGLAIGRQAISLRMVAAAAMLILVARPEALLGASFQLSFAAVAVIVAFYQSSLGQRLIGARRDRSLPWRAGRMLLALAVTGVLVEAALAPIAIAHFGRTGLYGVVANIVAIPFSSFVVMPAAAAALFLDPIGLGEPAFAALRWGIDVLILLAATVSAWPGAVERLPAMDMPLYAAVVIGGIWLCLWQERWRWLGAIPVAAAALLMAGHEPPDLIIHGEGRDLGFMTQRGELVTLRAGARSLVGRSWSDTTAADAVLSWEGSGYGRCSRDACTATIQRGGRAWTLLATRSRYPIARPVLAPSCEAADIVVSDRRLPGWCRPRWLKLDRARLEQTGAVAIRFDPLRIETAAEPRAGHPWATGR